MEVWKYIKGYENRYMISNHGNVMSLPLQQNSWEGRVLTPVFNNGNYPMVGLYKEGSGKPKSKPIHRLVAETFLPRVPGKEQINHIDGIKTNNHIDNLEWCNAKENIAHAIQTGLMPEKPALIKTSGPVLCHQTGKVYPSALMCSKDFNMSDTSIGNVCRGKTQHVNGYSFEYFEREQYLKLYKEQKTKIVIIEGYKVKDVYPPKPARHNKAVICTSTGEMFESAVKAAIHFGIDRREISAVVTHKRSSTHGLKFEFADKLLTVEERSAL